MSQKSAARGQRSVPPAVAGGIPAALTSSISVEWYTPARYVDAARDVLFDIELDPASCAYANQPVKAKRFFSPENGQDGLLMPWLATSVFLNPPYGRRAANPTGFNQQLWTNNLVQEYAVDNVQSAILLVNACTSEKWFQILWQFPICFTDHRIKFQNAIRWSRQPAKGSAFVYMGTRKPYFAEVFRQFGPIVRGVQ